MAASLLWVKLFCCVILPLNSLQSTIPFHSTNATGKYNRATDAYEVGTDESFSVGCNYQNVNVEFAHAEVRWSMHNYDVGLYGAYTRVFKKNDFRDDTVVDVSPEEIPKNAQGRLASGTIWLTFSKPKKIMYNQVNTTFKVSCEVLTYSPTAGEVNFQSDVNISVVEPAKILDTKMNISSQREKAAEGDDITLECVVEGYPRPTVTWFRRDGEALVHTEDGDVSYKGHILSLKDVTAAAAAIYVCTAANKLTNDAPTKTLELKIYEYCQQ